MRLFATAFLLLFTYAIQQSKPDVRSKEAGVQKRSAQEEADDAEQYPERNVPTVRECRDCFNVQTPNSSHNQSDAYNAKTDTLYRVYLWFTIIGVPLAGFGIFAIYKQTTATKDAAEATRVSAEATLRSAEAAERSVKLQENTQRQWVNLETWQAFRINPTDPLEVGFNVINPTSLPLTLHRVITTVNGKATEEEVPIGILAPSNPLVHSVGVTLAKEQESLYARNALALDIECTILFADSHGIHWRQEFGRRFLCGHTTKGIVTDTKNTLHESGVRGERGSREAELP